MMFDNSGDLTPRTQKVTFGISTFIGGVRGLRAASMWRSRWYRNAVADDDRIVADEHFLDDQTYDALPLDDVKGVRGFTQPREKRRERFRETQICRSFSRLFGNRLPLGSQGLLALTQWRHPLAQLLQREEVLLIGGQYALDAFS